MSHYTTLRTKMVEREYLTAGLDDMGYTYYLHEVEGLDAERNRGVIEVTATAKTGQTIQFRRKGGVYELVAAEGIRGINPGKLVADLSRRYAFHASMAKLESQGFNLVDEEVAEDGRIHLVLRRAV